MNSLCEASGHDWAPTAVYIAGILRIPCRRSGCTAGLRRQEPWALEPNGFPAAVNGIPLDIEDDPLGGVTKVVMREAAAVYELDDLPLVPGDVVIDIGAHVGIISIYLAKRYPGIRVYAFEPALANWKRLIRNIAANQATGVTPYNWAVTGDGRLVKMMGNPEINSGGMSLVSGIGAGPIISSVTLASIFSNLEINHCALLKIDCEGSEYEILTAGEALLDRVDYLRAEFHQRQGETKVQELAALCARHIKPENTKITMQLMGE